MSKRDILMVTGGLMVWLLTMFFMISCEPIKDTLEIPDDLQDVILHDTEPDEQPTDIPDGGDAIDITSIRWTGKAFTSAQLTATLAGAWMDGHYLHLNNGAPTDWPKKDVSGADCQGIICLFYEADGGIKGGKFDWLRPNQTMKGLENVHDGYQGHSMPSAGAKCWTCFVSVDEKQRSNVVEVERK